MSDVKIMQSKRKRLLIFAGLFFALAVPATIVKAALNVASDDFDGRGETLSWSIVKARERRTLIVELEAKPGELQFAGETVRFREAWLEERVLETHFLVWFPCNRRIGGYNLCFTLTEGDELLWKSNSFFVANDKRSGFSSHHTSGLATLYVEQLDEADVSKIRVSLVSSWKEPRPQNVWFVRKHG